MSIRSLPSDRSIDATLSLLRDGYKFIPRRCARLGTDAFRTRLLGRSAVCFHGPRWTNLFYGAEGVTRVGAMPAPVLRLLQDKGSVQQLEGAPHRHRKALFTGLLLDQDRIDALADAFRRVWLDRLAAWEAADSICLLTEVSDVLAEASCSWAGVPLDGDDLAQVSGALFGMVDQAGRVRPATLFALSARRRTERLLRDLIVRERQAPGAADTPFARIAAHRDAGGSLLPPEVAAVELLNVLRPLVAVGRYIAFLAMILHRKPDWRDRFRIGEDDLIEPFCEEVRRQAPFFPMTAAITTQQISWGDLSLPSGQWLLFDLYGTLHDPRSFPDPSAFRPERRLSWTRADDSFVPQGGGDVHQSHRCPGEMATVALMVEATKLLCRHIGYEVPKQSLTVRLSRFPAQPESGVRIADVRRLS